MGTAGDQAGFIAFAQSRRAPLVRAAWLMCHDHGLAEDLVQEALTKLAAKWHRVGDQAPEAYVRRILYRDLIRARRAGSDVWLVEGHEDRPSLATSDHASTVVERANLVAALQQLAPRQRAVIVLRYFEDLSVPQCAEALGISEGTVKSQTHDGVRALRALLGDRIQEDSAGGEE